MRKTALIAILIALVAGGVLFAYPRVLRHRIELTVYFQNAIGLRAGAPVRLAGVDVGTVTSVRARPDMQATPAEVIMRLQTPYELRIPSDSTVSLTTAGVLGETFAEINVLGASGAPVKSGDVLKAIPTEVLSTQYFLERLADIVQHKPCAPQEKDAPPAPTSNKHVERQPKSPVR